MNNAQIYLLAYQECGYCGSTMELLRKYKVPAYYWQKERLLSEVNSDELEISVLTFCKELKIDEISNIETGTSS